MTDETRQEAYDRGEAAGQITARLAEHDRHLAKINGEMARVADKLHVQNTELHAVVQGIARIEQRMGSDETTRISTAIALKDAEAARRFQSEQSWSPVARFSLVLGVVISLIIIVTAFVAAARP